LEYGSRVLLGEALILSCWRGRESRGRRVESQEAAPAGTETQFPGRHTKRGRRCLPQAGESARGHERRDYEGVKGGAGHWGNRTLVRARGAGRWADRRRGIGGERNGKIAASCAAVRVRVLLRFAMGWALPMPCLEIYLDGPASEPTSTSFLQTPIF